jgi:hypothetical protein
MASPANREFAFDLLSLDGKLNALYTTLDKFTSALTRLTERMVNVESHLSFPPATPLPPIIATAATSKKAKPKKGKNLVAPPATPTTSRPAPASAIRSISSEAALEKCSVTLQVLDAQAGHLIGRAGSGLQQVHDYSRAKVSVAAATGLLDLRAITIRGSAHEVRDALVAVGKRLARRRVRNPRDKKKKKKSGAPSQPLPPPTYSVPAPAPSPIPAVSRPPSRSVPPAPQVWVSPPEPNSSPQPTASAKLPLPSPVPMQLSTPSAPPSALPPGSPMVVDALQVKIRALQERLRLMPADTIFDLSLPPLAPPSLAKPSGSGRQTARRGLPFRR